MSGAGDLNGDGYANVIVGAPYYSDDQPAEGAPLLFFGWSGGLENVIGWRAFGNKAEAHFGYSVSGGADVARDGHVDLIVGAPDYRRSETIVGCAFGYYGVFSYTSGGERVYLPFLARR